MKIKSFIIIFLISFFGRSQEMTVFYKEKRKPAQVSTQESFDYSPVNSFYKKELARIRAAKERGMSKDSISLYHERLRYKGDSILKILKEKARQKKSLTIPVYDYITVLKINNDKSLYYPQEQVSNDTVSRNSTSERGKKLVDRRIHYNDSEIIYLDQSQRKKISALKVHKFDFKGREFLIEEALAHQEWILTEETKRIDQYICYKAVLKHMKNEKKVTAWYTRDIKVRHGPKGYYGLPGLILELQEGKKRIRFYKINLLSSEPVVVNPPTKGEKITREELNDLSRTLFDQY